MPRKKQTASPAALGFILKTADKTTTRYATVLAGHVALGQFAERQKLDVHVHEGGWDGTTCSSAFTKGGDMWLDAQAVLRREVL